jgi:transketolase
LPGPIYLRIGKRDDYALPGLDGRFRLGRIETVRDGKDLLIVSLGSISSEAVLASEKLASKGIQATLAIVSSLRPAPVEDLRALLPGFQLTLTVEEHYIDCGLGSMVSEVVAEHGIASRVLRCGVKRMPTACDGEARSRDLHGLSGEGICDIAVEALKELG